MQRETTINNAPIRVTEKNYLCIGDFNKSRTDWYFGKEDAPALIAFIQQWLDHDPEQELREKTREIMHSYLGLTSEYAVHDIIAAVREHDAKYRRET